MTTPLAEALAAFRQFNYEHVYLRPASQAQAAQRHRAAAGAGRALRRPAEPAARASTGVDAGSREALHAAVAYVGGMTDRFACRQGVTLLGWPVERLPRGIGTQG